MNWRCVAAASWYAAQRRAIRHAPRRSGARDRRNARPGPMMRELPRAHWCMASRPARPARVGARCRGCAWRRSRLTFRCIGARTQGVRQAVSNPSLLRTNADHWCGDRGASAVASCEGANAPLASVWRFAAERHSLDSELRMLLLCAQTDCVRVGDASTTHDTMGWCCAATAATPWCAREESVSTSRRIDDPMTCYMSGAHDHDADAATGASLGHWVGSLGREESTIVAVTGASLAARTVRRCCAQP